MISVIVTTYNHEKYIKEALDGILMQKDCPRFEIIIGNDCSNDKTGEIIEEYKQKYPDIINVLPREKNLGMLHNLKDCLSHCSGDYIAICEGDDYWIDEHKLKIQYEALLKDKNAAMCFNNIKTKNEKTGEITEYCENQKKLLNGFINNESLIAMGNPIANFSCCMYRRESIKKIPDSYFEDKENADFLFNLYVLRSAYGIYTKKVLSIYRLVETSSWSSLSDREKTVKLFKMFYKYNELFDYEYFDYFLRNFFYIGSKYVSACAFEKLKEKRLFRLTLPAFCNRKIQLKLSKIKKNTKRIAIVDDWFPQKKPYAFRNVEINAIMDNVENCHAYTMRPIYPEKGFWLPYIYGMTKDDFLKNRKAFLKYYPKRKGHIHYQPEYTGEIALAYSYFLVQTYKLLPWYEKNMIPFVFVLYPGGGFGLNNKYSDEMLKKTINSPCFRKVIVTQPVTKEYLLEKKYCPEDKIEYLPIGCSQFELNQITKHCFYKQDKQTLDVCFVAYKYTEKGYDKGYDLFIEAAKILSKKYDDIKFHCIGNFDENDIDVSEIKDKIKFWGLLSPLELKHVYSGMDICVSPNRPFAIFEGNFDGFPLGFEAMCFKTVLLTTDELNNNRGCFKDDEIRIIKPDSADIVNEISYLHENPNLISQIGEKGQAKIYQFVDPKMRGAKIAQILKEAAVCE